MKRIYLSTPLMLCLGLLTACSKQETPSASQSAQLTINTTTVSETHSTSTINTTLVQVIAPGVTPSRTVAVRSVTHDATAGPSAGTGSSPSDGPLTNPGNQAVPTTVVAGGQSAVTVLQTPVSMPGDSVRLSARSGSKVRIEGTSNIHDWQVESPLIGGSIVVGSNFPFQPGAPVPSSPVSVTGEAFVTVRSLKSVQKDGKPYSDKMDDIMFEKLLVQQYPRIVFQPASLVPSSAPAEAGTYKFDVSGELLVAGLAKQIQFPVTVTPQTDRKVRISGVATLKMTSFNIQPPAPLGMLIKTGDEVKVLFDWIVAPKN